MSNAAAILVVEDEHFLQLTLATILRNAGYQVDCTGTGRDAVTILKQGAYDLLFLDLNLPDVNSLDLLPVVHTQHPALRIVVFTADGTQDSIRESFKLGISDYIIKPADPDTILERVQKVLQS